MQNLERANSILRERMLTIRKLTKENSALKLKLSLSSEMNKSLLKEIASLKKMNSILVEEEEVFLKKESKNKKKKNNSHRKKDDSTTFDTD